MVGTPLAFSTELGGLIPLVDGHLRSPIAGLFVAGDAAGVGSVAAVVGEGRLAGMAAASSLGLASDEEVSAVRAAGGPELGWRLAWRAALPAISAQPYQ
jgi:sarcosine oxidase subunit alpha